MFRLSCQSRSGIQASSCLGPSRSSCGVLSWLLECWALWKRLASVRGISIAREFAGCERLSPFVTFRHLTCHLSSLNPLCEPLTKRFGEPCPRSFGSIGIDWRPSCELWILSRSGFGCLHLRSTVSPLRSTRKRITRKRRSFGRSGWNLEFYPDVGIDFHA